MDAICKCPKCGDSLIRRSYISKKDNEEKEFLAHEHFDKDATEKCDFGFFLNFMGTKLSDQEVKDLIETGKTKKPVTIKVPLKYVDGKVSIDYEALRK